MRCEWQLLDDLVGVGGKIVGKTAQAGMSDEAERKFECGRKAERADHEPDNPEKVTLSAEGEGRENQKFDNATSHRCAEGAGLVGLAVVVEVAEFLGAADKLEDPVADEAADKKGENFGEDGTKRAEAEEPTNKTGDDPEGAGGKAGKVGEFAAGAVMDKIAQGAGENVGNEAGTDDDKLIAGEPGIAGKVAGDGDKNSHESCQDGEADFCAMDAVIVDQELIDAFKGGGRFGVLGEGAVWKIVGVEGRDSALAGLVSVGGAGAAVEPKVSK